MSTCRDRSRRRLSNKAAFKTEVARWAQVVNVRPSQIRVQPMKRKWASCSTNGWISFNDELLEMPRQFQEYVIVHELVHLQVPNHGKLFKSLLRSYLPDWEKTAARTGKRDL